MISFKCVLVVLAFIGICASVKVKLPDGFKICKRSDPNLKACMVEAAFINNDLLAKGYPEIDFPPGNPLHLQHVDFKVGEPGSQLAFTVALDNIVAEYEVTKFESFDVDLQKKKISIVEHFKYMTMNATHTSSGKLFIGQINGKGQCTVTLYNPVMVYDISLSEVKRNGEMYVHVDTMELKISPKKVQGYFENLIGRDKNINDALNKAVNENWKVVYGPISPLVEKELAKVLVVGFNRFFDKVPKEQIFPE